ncbi:MAG TPA: hypothetical protein VGJ15_05760 [Pirellulales bacterium]|jgi:hypothetical protein
MGKRSRSFSLKQMFACTACFAAAFGVPSLAALLVDRYAVSFTGKAIVMLAAVCVMGAFIGGGVGLLFDRFWRSACWGVIGIILVCMLAGVVLVSWR